MRCLIEDHTASTRVRWSEHKIMSMCTYFMFKSLPSLFGHLSLFMVRMFRILSSGFVVVLEAEAWPRLGLIKLTSNLLCSHRCPKTSKSPLRVIGIGCHAWFMWYWGSRAGRLHIGQTLPAEPHPSPRREAEIIDY